MPIFLFYFSPEHKYLASVGFYFLVAHICRWYTKKSEYHKSCIRYSILIIFTHMLPFNLLFIDEWITNVKRAGNVSTSSKNILTN